MGWSSLLASIPATFWGVVVGAFFTVLGVVLTNRANLRQLRMQHEHDQTENAKARDLELRKDIYLDAAEAVSAGLNAVARFGDLNIEQKDIAKHYIEKSPAMARVNIVANKDTARAFAEFSQELSGSIFRLASKRLKVEVLRGRLRSVEDAMEACRKEQERLVAIMKESNLAGVQDQRQWDVLNRSFEFERQQNKQNEDMLEELNNELMPKQMELIRECVEEAGRLYKLLAPLVGAVRRELGLPFEEDEFRRIFSESHEEMAGYLDGFIEDIMQEVGASKHKGG